MFAFEARRIAALRYMFKVTPKLNADRRRKAPNPQQAGGEG
jgi:hypothetical protein